MTFKDLKSINANSSAMLQVSILMLYISHTGAEFNFEIQPLSRTCGGIFGTAGF
jgi:hypothetical protein